MNRYNELLDWLQNEHNEVFNQWAQLEEVMRLEEAQKLNNANAQLLEQFKKKKDQYEELLDLVKEEEGVSQTTTEVVE